MTNISEKQKLEKPFIENAYEVQHSDKAQSEAMAQQALSQALKEEDRLTQARAHYLLGIHAFNETLYEKAVEHFDLSLQLGKAIQNLDLQASSLNYLGNVYLAQNNAQQATDRYFEALKIKDSGEHVVRIYMNLGTVYKNLLDFESAINYYLEAQEFNRNGNKNEHLEAFIFANIGALHFELAQIDRAYDYIKRAAATFERLEDKNSLSIAKLFFANYYETKSDFRNSLREANEALQLGESNRNQFVISEALYHIAKFYLTTEEEETGLNYLTKALDICKEFDLKETKAKILKDLGIFYKTRNLLSKAQTSLEEAAVTFQSLNSTNELDFCYHRLSEIFELMGDYSTALAYARKSYETQRSEQNMQDNVRRIELQTNLKAKEHEIENLKQKNRLQFELLEKNEHIKHQNEKLKIVNEELTRFAYVISHDFKEPLRMIGSYTQLVERRLEDKLTEETRDFMHYITDSVRRMNDMIDTLLQYARLDTRLSEIEEVDLNLVLFEVELNLKAVISETDTEIKKEQLPTIRVPYAHMIQIFQNLISNAIKFRSEKTPCIVIHYEVQDQYLIISVRDNGIGIVERDIEKIFEIFYRSENQKRYEGTGIGLAICKKIMQKLGGKIEVKSNKEKGSTFLLYFPKKVIEGQQSM